MKTGPRYKIAKRLGASVFEKTQTQKFALSAERSERNKRGGRRSRVSEYGKQMLEKQKVRITYGIPERQFRQYVAKALVAKTTPIERLHELLELRLDNVIYRLGLATTRRAARQMVAHGHITVNGKKIRVPSHQVGLEDRIAVRDGSKNHAAFVGFNERFAEQPLASWLSWNPQSMEGGITTNPTAASADPAGDLAAVLSFYTR